MASSIRSSVRALAFALAIANVAPAFAQSLPPAGASGSAMVRGHVETPGREKQLPVAGVMVTVHRVGTDSSGPLDSVRTGPDGQYFIRYRKFGDDAAVYFAAAVYKGIAYFSSPLQSGNAVGDEAEITVFDTTSKRVDFHVQGHHVVVSSPTPNGARNIVEVWEISNDTTVTVVGRDSLSPVWTTAIPHGATHFQGGPGDVTPSAMVVRGDSVALLSTFGPGVKQISYTYTLPSSSFPLDLPVSRRTNVLELLVEEPMGQVTGATLHAQDAATTQGRTFKRWLAQDVAAGERIHINVPTSSAAARSRLFIGLAIAFVAVMAIALLRALRRRSTGAPVAIAPSRDMLLAAIASLDARRERGDATLTDAAYQEQRARLKAQLSVPLAPESAAP